MLATVTACAALGVSVIALVITLKNKKTSDFANNRREETILSNEQVKCEVERQRNYEQYMEKSARFIYQVALEKAFRDLQDSDKRELKHKPETPVQPQRNPFADDVIKEREKINQFIREFLKDW